MNKCKDCPAIIDINGPGVCSVSPASLLKCCKVKNQLSEFDRIFSDIERKSEDKANRLIQKAHDKASLSRVNNK